MTEEKTEKSHVGTAALYNSLFRTESLEQFFQKNVNALRIPVFHEHITELCRRRREMPEQIIKRANLERSFGYQIFKGTRKPSRDTVLQLAFAFEADVDETQEMLKYAEKSPLYPRIKRDSAIIYCLHRHFTLLKTQAILYDLELPLLGGKGK